MARERVPEWRRRPVLLVGLALTILVGMLTVGEPIGALAAGTQTPQAQTTGSTAFIWNTVKTVKSKTTAITASASTDLLTRTNAYRMKYKRKKLGSSSCLMKLAKTNAVQQATEKKMFDASTSQLKAAMKSCHFHHAAGANAAQGFTSNKAVMTAWMHSADHRANILGTHFTKAAMATAVGGNKVRYYAQIFAG